ncbi:hypothetical protein LCGC14_1395650 [marine sediment metagenome]|uniref:Uncharacterized protein n=1 Tax=marine sediment metagenome TaxID=412755 RepID=A0A0F9JYU0_9ZZZZ
MATREEMTVAANQALTELSKQDLTTMLAIELIAWLRRWFLKAGYKRLCRGLLRIAPPKSD